MDQLAKVEQELSLARAARRPGAATPQATLAAVTVSVYVHVINKGAGLPNGDVPDATIRAQIDLLNKSFSGQTGGADTGFRFTLAKIDRTTNERWFNMAYGSSEEKEAKTSLGVKGKNVLNFYTAAPRKDGKANLGFARWPWHYASNPEIDGVVVRYSTLPGGMDHPWDLGYTATHEVGHWLGLLHTFDGGCSTTNDQVSDTPAQKEASIQCTPGLDTCTGPDFPGPDPTDNFMDTTEDRCVKKFSQGQVTRMKDMYEKYRKP